MQKRSIHMQTKKIHIQKRSVSSPFLSLYKSLFLMGTFAQKRHIHMQKRCIHVQTRSLSSPFLPLFKSRRFNPNIMSYRVGAPKRDLFIRKRERFIRQRDLFIRKKDIFICKRELSPSIFSRSLRHGISTRKLWLIVPVRKKRPINIQKRYIPIQKRPVQMQKRHIHIQKNSFPPLTLAF